MKSAPLAMSSLYFGTIITMLIILVGLNGIASADEPKVPTSAPYIVLSDNLDEPNGYGFCLDTFGPGQSDLLHTHSCKPAKEGQPRNYAGHDARFMYDASTGRIQSYAFEGVCMQALVAKGWTVFALLNCSDHPRQKFVHNSSDGTLRLSEDKKQCVTVADKTVPAGPWVKRPLALQECDSAKAALKRWTVVSK
ncbi:hypothetical protein NBRC116602_06440 [Hyphomicrobiales bacterium 4NK60-0047b]